MSKGQETTRLPVRSVLFKQRTGGLVVRWVTTSEYPLLYIFALFRAPISIKTPADDVLEFSCSTTVGNLSLLRQNSYEDEKAALMLTRLHDVDWSSVTP